MKPGRTSGFSATTGWLPDQIAKSQKKPLRIFLSAGSLESDFPYPYLTSNRRLALVLDQCGYEVKYVEYPGGHDVENWRDRVGEALAYVWGDTL